MSVSLKHVAYINDGMIHFYDGSLRTKAGVVEIPLDKPHWAEKAWRDGYRIGRDNIEIRSVSEYFTRESERQIATLLATANLFRPVD